MPNGDRSAGDGRARAVVREIQDEGTIWLSGTTWHGLAAIRISVSNWATGLGEAEIAVATILRATDRARANPSQRRKLRRAGCQPAG